MTHCPVCGRIRPDIGQTDEPKCLPSNCPSWETIAIFDHEQRQWLNTDQDGYVTDGRPLHRSQITKKGTHQHDYL